MVDRKKYDEKYRGKNRERLLEESRQYRKDNPEKERKRKNQWRADHPEYFNQWRKDNLEYQKKCKQYREENCEEIKKYMKQWGKDNREKINQYRKNKWKGNLRFNLSSRIRKAIWRSLKSNKAGRHWEDLVGYTLDDLVKRLKKTMPKNYTWKDYLEGKLHIDHKIPISVHNFDNPNQIDFKNCWALNNLQLLPARENRIKSDKLIRPFQPALQI